MSTYPAKSAAAAALFALAAAAPGVGQIETASLGDIDPMLIGARGGETGALPRDLWAGSDNLGIAETAGRLTGESRSRAANRLAARVLESAGDAPGGAGDPRAAAAARSEALLELGRIGAVDAIVRQTPRGLDEPEFAYMIVRGALATNDILGACEVADGLRSGRDGGLWLRLRTACYAWAGERSAAQLTLDLAREADADIADEEFATWVFAAADKTKPRNAPTPRDALEVALARSADVAVTADDIARLPLSAVAGVALDAETDPATRAVAAERAAFAGALDAEAFIGVLEALAPSEGLSMSELLEAGRADETLRGAALLRRAALSTDGGPFIAAEAMSAALDRATAPAAFETYSEAFAVALAAIPPSAELADDAPLFARAAAAAGDVDAAHAWLRVSAAPPAAPAAFGPGFGLDGRAYDPRSEPDFSGSPIPAVERLDAEAVAAAANPYASPTYLAGVAAARLASTLSEDDDAQAAARRDALVLLALGAESSPALRRAAEVAAAEAEPAADAAIQALAAARYAAQAGAVGEAALDAARAVGEAGPGHAPTAAVAIEILRALGLEEDARAIAVETMLAGRLAFDAAEEG